MKVVALAGGIGAGKFLRGLARVVPGDDLSVVVNVADDYDVHGLRVSPDPDSVTYWLGDVFDRERGWGRRDETFRATEELRALGAAQAWFNLGDLDLATHLLRTDLLARGATMSEVTARIAERFGVTARLLPVTDDRVATRIDAVDAEHGRRAGPALPGVLGGTPRRRPRQGRAIRRCRRGRAHARGAGGDRRRRRRPLLSVEPGGVDRADPRGAGHPRRGRGAAAMCRRA